MNAAQVQQILFSTTGLSVEQQHEPWMHSYVLDKCQNKDFPPSAKKAYPLACKTGELGAGDTFIDQKKWMGDRPVQFQKCVALQKKLLCQRQCPPIPHSSQSLTNLLPVGVTLVRYLQLLPLVVSSLSGCSSQFYKQKNDFPEFLWEKKFPSSVSHTSLTILLPSLNVMLSPCSMAIW